MRDHSQPVGAQLLCPSPLKSPAVPQLTLSSPLHLTNPSPSSIKYTLLTLPPSTVEETILTHNTLPTTHGLLVYYPIHSTAQDTYLANLVSPSKDVEGLSHLHLSNMYTNTRFLDPPSNLRKSILPCTPLALIKILEFLHIYSPHLPPGNRLFGHKILILNRSEVVGRPLAALLANDGATVYSADVSGLQQFTRGQGIRKRRHEVVEMPGVRMEEVVPQCDVVITGVPGEGFKFPCGLLREGAVCVNFSTEKVGFLLPSLVATPEDFLFPPFASDA